MGFNLPPTEARNYRVASNVVASRTPDGMNSYEVYRFHLLSGMLFDLTYKWRVKCGNDSDAVFVFMAFVYAGASEAVKIAGLKSELPEKVSATLSAYSISSMTNIPRETVRRKLRLLEGCGMLTAGPGASYTLHMERDQIVQFLGDTPQGEAGEDGRRAR